MSIKNFNETIGNWTRDLPACSAAPQPTAPQRTPILRYRFSKFEEAVTGETHSSGLSHTVTYFVKLYVLFTKIMQTISRIRTAPYGMGTEVLRLGKSDGDVILIIHLQVEGKSEWSYTSSPLICLHSADRNTCTFTTRLTASNNVKSCKKIKWQKKKYLTIWLFFCLKLESRTSVLSDSGAELCTTCATLMCTNFVLNFVGKCDF